MKSLCIDVGGSRVKAAVISGISYLDSIKRISPIAIGTLGWLNQSLPEIVSVNNWASIVNQKDISGQFENIALCVPGPVENGQFKRGDLSVPENLLHHLESNAPKDIITLVKDADAWTSGACHYLEMINNSPQYPAIALAFGTGIGLSIAVNENTIHSIEISRWSHGFKHLEEASGRSISEPWLVHHILGLQYFSWVKDHKKHWDYDRVRNEFTKRLIALIKDLEPNISKSFGKIKSLIIGGGNAQFVSIRALNKNFPVRIDSFWDRKIPVNPDVIPLIGLYRLGNNQNLKISPLHF